MIYSHDDEVASVLSLWRQLSGERGTWEQHWEEVSERVLPRQRDFIQTRTTGGEKRTEKIYDSTAPLALDKFAAALNSLVTPQTEVWHKLRHPDPELNSSVAVQQWFEQLNAMLFATRYGARANFASQVSEVYAALGAFGTGPLFVDSDGRGGFRYRAMFLGDIYIAVNHQGLVDTVIRKFMLTHRQAVDKFGDRCPDKIATLARAKPEQESEYIHCVAPNDNQEREFADYRGMPLKSVYVCLETKQVCERGGYRRMPYMVPRYTIGPRERYGRSPAMLALPDIKMLNEMEKTIIRAGHLATDPPLLLPDNGVIAAFQMKPAALNYGGVDGQGRQMVMPLQTGANFPLGMEMSNQKRQVINEAFLVTLFQVLMDNPGQMTATEVLERAQEKGALMAPAAGRLQTELLGPLIEREIDLLADAGRIPPPPRELVDAAGEDGVEFEVEYESPIMRAMKSGEGVAIARTLELLGPLAQLDESVIDVLNADEMFKMGAEAFGAPARIFKTADQVAAIREGRAQQQQAEQLLAAAPVAAQTAKTLNEAQQMAGAV